MMKDLNVIQCFDEGKKGIKMPTFKLNRHGLCYKMVRNQDSDIYSYSDIM